MNTLKQRLKDRYGYAMTVLRGLVKTDFKMRYQGSFLGVAWSVLKPLRLNTLKQRLKDRYGYAMTVLRGLVKTDFKMRYQGSFLGVAWSVLKPLMLFAVMYVVFAKFMRMTDGTPTYPVVLLLGISSWQFVTETVGIGLRSIVDRGDLLRKVHFPNYIVVVSASIGSLISLGINYLVVLVFALFARVQFTWRVLWLPLNVLELYVIALALALILSTFYVFYRDVLHIWEVLQQIIFYAMPIIYPLSFITDKHPEYSTIANLELMNPIAQTIQDIRHNFIAPATQPTVWNTFDSWWVKLIPVVITALLLWFGVYVFRKNSRRFAEVM